MYLYTPWSYSRKLKYMGNRDVSTFCGVWNLDNLEMAASLEKQCRNSLISTGLTKKHYANVLSGCPQGHGKGK